MIRATVAARSRADKDSVADPSGLLTVEATWPTTLGAAWGAAAAMIETTITARLTSQIWPGTLGIDVPAGEPSLFYHPLGWSRADHRYSRYWLRRRRQRPSPADHDVAMAAGSSPARIRVMVSFEPIRRSLASRSNLAP